MPTVANPKLNGLPAHRSIIEAAYPLPPALVWFFTEAFSECYDQGLRARIETPPAHVYTSLESFFQATRIAQECQRTTRRLEDLPIQVEAFRVRRRELSPERIEPALWIPALFPWDAVALHARMLVTKDGEGPNTRKILKSGRIALKIARNIFYGFSETERPPAPLNRISSSLGRLNDALALDHYRDQVPKLAEQVLRDLGRFNPHGLHLQLKLANTDQIIDRMRSHAMRIGMLGTSRRVDHEELHTCKKVSIGLLNFFRLLHVLDTDPEKWSLSALTCLAVFNHQVGRVFEKSLQRRAEKGLEDDENSRVKLPRKLRKVAVLLSNSIQLGLLQDS